VVVLLGDLGGIGVDALLDRQDLVPHGAAHLFAKGAELGG
jgi:hypothetical protein